MLNIILKVSQNSVATALEMSAFQDEVQDGDQILKIPLPFIIHRIQYNSGVALFHKLGVSILPPFFPLPPLLSPGLTP